MLYVGKISYVLGNSNLENEVMCFNDDQSLLLKSRALCNVTSGLTTRKMTETGRMQQGYVGRTH